MGSQDQPQVRQVESVDRKVEARLVRKLDLRVASLVTFLCEWDIPLHLGEHSSLTVQTSLPISTAPTSAMQRSPAWPRI